MCDSGILGIEKPPKQHSTVYFMQESTVNIMENYNLKLLIFYSNLSIAKDKDQSKVLIEKLN